MSLFGQLTGAAALGLWADCRIDGDPVPSGDSPDVGAAGGADDAPPDDSAPAQDGAETPPAADAVDDEDDEPDLKDDAHANKPWANDPDFRRALNRARRAQRQLAKHRPIIEKVRAFNIGDRLDDVVTRANEYERLQRQAAETRRAPGGTSRADRAEWTPPAFDREKFIRESNFPYDPSDPGARYMLDHAEQQHNQYYGLFGVVRQLAQEIAETRQWRQGDQESRVTGAWRSAMDDAAAKLPEADANGLPIRTLFKDAVVGAYWQAKARGTQPDRGLIQRVLSHYLGNFKPASKAAATEAAKQRMAQANGRRPGSAAFSGGAPSGAHPDRSSERVSDVTSRLTGGRKYYGGRARF